MLVADAAVPSVEPRFILPKPGTSHAYDRCGATGMQYHLAIVQMQRAQARAGRPIEPTRCFGTAANGTHKTTPIHQSCPFGLTSISVGQGIGRCSAEEHAVFFFFPLAREGYGEAAVYRVRRRERNDDRRFPTSLEPTFLPFRVQIYKGDG